MNLTASDGGFKSMAAISPKASSIRPSKMGRWRAFVLIAVHVIAAIHIWHWKATGATISPVEPSESMQTLELGYVNAGFIFFALAILSTVIFGRWFCGWGCHLVALQDLCGWLLKKIGIRPKPIRSRFLVWIPVFAAFYMFVYPQFARIWAGKRAPAWAMHLTTESFWATFPSAPIAILTFAVCGFLIVYLLGAKGFCTYGCPYGGIFYNVDRLARGRIRVTDDCNQCGHCTAVCTSNVRVAEEVNLHRMVVDPGCMKCMDCVSVCPSGALYFGFSQRAGKRDSLPITNNPPKQKRQKATSRTFDFTFGEEVGLGLFFALGFYAFRGLYDAIPFLLAIGLASISSFVLLFGIRLATQREVRFQRWQLKRANRIGAVGWVYAIVAIGLAAFVGESAVLQYRIHEGNRFLAEAADTGSEQAAARARDSFEAALKLSPFPIAEWEYKLGSAEQNLGHFDAAIVRFKNALRLDPNRSNTRIQLAHLYALTGDKSSAAEEYGKLVAVGVDLGQGWTEYAIALVDAGKLSDAEAPLKRAIAIEPNNAILKLNLGMALAQSSRFDESIEWLAKFVEQSPSDFRGWLNLGLVQATMGKRDEAAVSLERALNIDPKSSGSWAALARIRAESGDRVGSETAIWKALSIDPLTIAVVQDALELSTKLQSGNDWLRRATRAMSNDPRWAFLASGLVRQSGNASLADELLQRARKIDPNLPAL